MSLPRTQRLTALLATSLVFAAALWLGARSSDADPRPSKILVLGPKGRPLEGAHLRRASKAILGRAVFDRTHKSLATTDARGRFSLGAAGLPPQGGLIVSAPGLAPALLPAGPGPATVRLMRARTLGGRIRLARGTPAAKLVVLAVPVSAHADLIHMLLTDAAGGYAFDQLHAGAWDVLLQPKRGRLQPIGRTPAGVDVGETRLQDSTAIRGRILDSDGTHRQPVPGVAFKLVALAGGGAEAVPSLDVSTGEDGTFLASGMAEGVYEVQMVGDAWAFDPRPPRVQAERGRHRDLPTWFARKHQNVKGVVHDEDGKPIAGVSVRLVADPSRPLPPGAEKPGTRIVQSDPSGRFVIRKVPPAEGYRLVAWAPGRSTWTSHAFRVDVAEPTILKPFRIRLGWQIVLRIRTLDGGPVAGARVVATAARRPSAADDPLWAETVRRVTSGADGVARLVDLPEDDVLLMVAADGYDPGMLVVDYPRVSNSRRAEITLNSGVSLAGQITVPPGGTSGPFEVRVRRRDGGGETRITAGADGHFRFAHLSDTAYDLSVWRVVKPAAQHLVTLENVLPGSEEHLEIHVPSLRSIRGQVDSLDPLGPAAQVLVEAQRYDPATSRYRWALAAKRVLERGVGRSTFALDGLPPGAYAVRVVQGALDTGTVGVVLDPDDVEGLTLTMPSGARVAGAVLTAEGKPLLGASVRLTRMHGEDDAPIERAAPLVRRSSERGDFMFEGVAPGLWRLEASDPERSPVVEVIRLRDGEVLVLDDLMLGGGGRIEGSVEDAAGRALDAVHVHVRRFDGDGKSTFVRTDGEGRFRVDHVRPGVWLLRVSAGTVAGGPWIESIVHVVEGETSTVSFTAGEDGSIGGTVRRRGAPVAGAVIDLVHEPLGTMQPLRRYRTSTGADGRFAVEHLRAGHYTVQVQSGAWRTTEGIHLEPSDAIELDLEAFEGRLRGRVRSRDGEAVAGAFVEATPLGDDGRPLDRAAFVAEGRTDPRGAFVLRGLPPGRYTLAVSAPGLPPGRFEGAEADLAGADYPVEMIMGRGGTIDLHVHDENERGVTGATVWIEDAEGTALHRHAYVTGARGHLRIEGIPVGVVRVRVRARGLGRPALHTLTMEEGHTHPLMVALLRAGSIRLRVTGEASDPLARTRIDIVRADTGEILARRRPLSPIRLRAPWGYVPRTGVVDIGDLEAGHYIARISAGSAYEPANVAIEVKAGLTAEVRVTLAPR